MTHTNSAIATTVLSLRKQGMHVRTYKNCAHKVSLAG